MKVGRKEKPILVRVFLKFPALKNTTGNCCHLVNKNRFFDDIYIYFKYVLIRVSLELAFDLVGLFYTKGITK